jgi:TPR repeat protein
MRLRWKQLFFVIALSSALLAASAQTDGPDAALVAKANSGDAAAQVALGDKSCAATDGSTPNSKQLAQCYATAAEWYRKAAEQGSVAGELRLAAVYRDGRGVAQDRSQAADWYRKAAEQGDVFAQATLGALYSMGQGVPQSDVEAYYWLALAAAAPGPDQEKYAANRQNMAARITADELADAQERVEKWLTAHPRPQKKE